MHPFEPGSRGGAGVVRNARRRISPGPERLRFRRRTVATIIFSFPIAGLGSRGSETIFVAAAFRAPRQDVRRAY